MSVRVPHFRCWCWPLGRGRRPQGMTSQAPPSYRMALGDVPSAAHSGQGGRDSGTVAGTGWIFSFAEALGGAASVPVSVEFWGQNIGVLGLTLPHASGHMERSAMGFRTVTCTGHTCMYKAAMSSKRGQRCEALPGPQRTLQNVHHIVSAYRGHASLALIIARHRCHCELGPLPSSARSPSHITMAPKGPPPSALVRRHQWCCHVATCHPRNTTR